MSDSNYKNLIFMRRLPVIIEQFFVIRAAERRYKLCARRALSFF